MTWPGWGDVLPTLALLLGLAASVAGVCWALVRLFLPVAAKAAQDAADALYERLRDNDFKHVEDRVAIGLEAVNKRLDGIDGRLDRMEDRTGKRLGRMEAVLEDVRRNVAVLAAGVGVRGQTSDGPESG